MTNYIQNVMDLSNNFILSTTIPNGSIFKTGYEINYNGTFYDIAQVYNIFDTIPMPYKPYTMINTNYLCDVNNIPYDIVRILYNSYKADYLGTSGQNGINGPVYAIAVLGTNIYVGGNFTTVTDSTGTISANYIAMWNGSSWSALGIFNLNGPVYAIDISSTDVYVGGDFTKIMDDNLNVIILPNYIAKWNTTNSTWSALGTLTNNGTSAPVNAIDISGVNVYVGGDFNTVSSSLTQINMSANRIAIWNGSSWYPLGVGANNGVNLQVYAIESSTANVYVGGNFTTVSSSTNQINSSAKCIAIWNGSSWSALGTTTNNGTNNLVTAIAVSGTNVYVGGFFTTVSSSTQTNGSLTSPNTNRIAMWNGSEWSALGTYVNSGISGGSTKVNVITVINSEIYIGGNFTVIKDSVQTISTNNIAKWDGLQWSVLATLSDEVYAIILFNSEIYIGGNFTTVSGISANYIAKLNGTTWSALGTTNNNGTGGTVYALAVLNSILYVGGNFTTITDSSVSNTRTTILARRIAKWNNSTWSVLGTAAYNGTTGLVNSIAVLNSTLYVGGNFTAVSSSTNQINVSANYIAKWDGSSWSALGTIGTTSLNGTNSTVNKITVSETNIYVGGMFTRVSDSTQNISANYIAKWDGLQWSALGISTTNGTSDQVKEIAVSGTNIYVGGEFITVTDSTRSISANRIAKWDGSLWSAFGTFKQLKNGTNNVVNAIKVSGTNIYVAGTFNRVSNSMQTILATYIAKWDGSMWTALGESNPNGIINAIEVLNSDVYIGGSFTTVSNISANYIAKWNGSQWSALGTTINNGTGGTVYALAVLNSTLYVGGDFILITDSNISNTRTTISGKRIAMWNGSAWSALGTGVNNGTNNIVYALAVLNLTLYVGGSFLTASSSTTQVNMSANRIAIWNTVNLSWSPLGTGANNGTGGTVNAIAVLNSTLYVGGSFTTVSSSTSQINSSANYVAKWDGSQWYALGTSTNNGTNGTVKAIAVSGSNVYIGGSFTIVKDSVQNISANYIAMWNDLKWSNLGPSIKNGTNDTVNAIAVLNSTLYVGGNFNKVSNSNQTISANYIAKWDSSIWYGLGENETFSIDNGTNNNVNAIAISGTNIYIGGLFDTLSDSTNSVMINCIAKWNGSLWSAFNGTISQNGTNEYVDSIEIDIYNNLYVGGNFTKVSTSTEINKSANYFAIWNGSTWDTIANNSDNGPNQIVNTIKVTDKNVYVGGFFNKITDSLKSIFVNNIFKL